MRVSVEDSHGDWAGLKAVINRERATEHNELPRGHQKLQCIVFSHRLWTDYNNNEKVCQYTKSPFISYLSILLINDPKLEIVADHMFIKSDDQS